MAEILKLGLLAIKISIIVQLFAIGLETTWQDATYLFRRPKLLLNSVLARNVAVPLMAIVLIKAFAFTGVIAFAIAVLSITPVPPILPKEQIRMGSRTEYVLGLLFSQTVLAIVTVPLTVELMNWVFGSQVHFGWDEVAVIMLNAILIPLAAGMLAARLFPKLHDAGHYLMSAGAILLIVGVLPLLPFAWKAFSTLSGNGTFLALAVFVVGSTAIGHLLGGPDPRDRSALGVASSARHPAIALAIAKSNFPDQSSLIAGAVVIYLIFRTILSIPYSRSRKARHA